MLFSVFLENLSEPLEVYRDLLLKFVYVLLSYYVLGYLLLYPLQHVDIAAAAAVIWLLMRISDYCGGIIIISSKGWLLLLYIGRIIGVCFRFFI